MPSSGSMPFFSGRAIASLVFGGAEVGTGVELEVEELTAALGSADRFFLAFFFDFFWVAFEGLAPPPEPTDVAPDNPGMEGSPEDARLGAPKARARPTAISPLGPGKRPRWPPMPLRQVKMGCFTQTSDTQAEFRRQGMSA